MTGFSLGSLNLFHFNFVLVDDCCGSFVLCFVLLIIWNAIDIRKFSVEYFVLRIPIVLLPVLYILLIQLTYFCIVKRLFSLFDVCLASSLFNIYLLKLFVTRRFFCIRVELLSKAALYSIILAETTSANSLLSP